MTNVNLTFTYMGNFNFVANNAGSAGATGAGGNGGSIKGLSFVADQVSSGFAFTASSGGSAAGGAGGSASLITNVSATIRGAGGGSNLSVFGRAVRSPGPALATVAMVAMVAMVGSCANPSSLELLARRCR